MSRRYLVLRTVVVALALTVGAVLPGWAQQPAGASAGATTPSATDVSPPAATAGTGTVVFFRGKELLGAAVGYRIFDGEVELGKLKYGTYFAVQLPAGPHEFVVNSWRRFPFPLEVEAGQIHYLLGGVTTGDTHPYLWISDAAAFEDMRGSLRDVSVGATAPSPRSAPAAPADVTKRQIVGRLKVAREDGRVYYPSAGSSAPSDKSLVERFTPRLSLLRLGSMLANDWTELKLRRNGTLSGSVAPGDYALASFSSQRGGRGRIDLVALLRVPAAAPSVYVGDLTIIIELENTADFLESQPYYVSRAEVTVDEGAAQSLVEPASGPSAVSPWCLQIGSSREVVTLNHSIAIATLSAGCDRPAALTDGAL